MKSEYDLPVMAFKNGSDLRSWLEQNHQTSKGIWVRINKLSSNFVSVTFEELLDESLCYGWSESMRRRGDEVSYLQLFTPRKTKGTTSKRNQQLAQRLIREGRMTNAGHAALNKP